MLLGKGGGSSDYFARPVVAGKSIKNPLLCLRVERFRLLFWMGMFCLTGESRRHWPGLGNGPFKVSSTFLLESVLEQKSSLLLASGVKGSIWYHLYSGALS